MPDVENFASHASDDLRSPASVVPFPRPLPADAPAAVDARQPVPLAPAVDANAPVQDCVESVGDVTAAVADNDNDLIGKLREVLSAGVPPPIPCEGMAATKRKTMDMLASGDGVFVSIETLEKIMGRHIKKKNRDASGCVGDDDDAAAVRLPPPPPPPAPIGALQVLTQQTAFGDELAGWRPDGQEQQMAAAATAATPADGGAATQLSYEQFMSALGGLTDMVYTLSAQMADLRTQLTQVEAKIDARPKCGRPRKQPQAPQAQAQAQPQPQAYSQQTNYAAPAPSRAQITCEAAGIVQPGYVPYPASRAPAARMGTGTAPQALAPRQMTEEEYGAYYGNQRNHGCASQFSGGR